MWREVPMDIGEAWARRGWGLLLVVSVLLILNGVVWFFIGPRLSWFQDATGVPLSTFRGQYPIVADHLASSARQVAIWNTAFGALALAGGLEGFRRASRSAWITCWIVVAALAVLAVNYLVAGENVAVLGMFFGGALLCAIGLLVARAARTGTHVPTHTETRLTSSR